MIKEQETGAPGSRKMIKGSDAEGGDEVYLYEVAWTEGHEPIKWKLQGRLPTQPDGKRPQRTRTFDDLAEAEKWATIFREQGITRGLQLLDEGPLTAIPTVTGLVEKHVKAMTGVTPDYREDCVGMLRNHITPILGGVRCDRLTRDHVIDWINGMEQRGLGGKTIRNIHALLSGALTYGVQRELLAKNVAFRVRLPDSSRQIEPMFMTPDEIQQLLKVVRPFYVPFVLAALGTGMRFSELSALRVCDLRTTLDGLDLTVASAWKAGGPTRGSTKTVAGRRIIPLPTSTVTDVLMEATQGKDWTGLLFTTPEDEPIRNDPFHRTCWRPTMKDLRAQGWTKEPRFHDLRHTAVSLMLQGGADIMAVSKIIGHKSVKTTWDVYGHLSDHARLRATSVLHEALNAFPAHRHLAAV